MIIGFGTVHRAYHAAAASFGLANAFAGESNAIVIGRGHISWTGQPFTVSDVESIYFHPTFDTPHGIVNKALKLFGRDPRPPAGRLTRR